MRCGKGLQGQAASRWRVASRPADVLAPEAQMSPHQLSRPMPMQAAASCVTLLSSYAQVQGRPARSACCTSSAPMTARGHISTNVSWYYGLPRAGLLAPASLAGLSTIQVPLPWFTHRL